MGGDSCSKGRGFESHYCIMDGHFFTFICCKNCSICLKKKKTIEKDAEDGPFLKNPSLRLNSFCSLFQMQRAIGCHCSGLLRCRLGFEPHLSFWSCYTVKMTSFKHYRLFLAISRADIVESRWDLRDLPVDEEWFLCARWRRTCSVFHRLRRTRLKLFLNNL